MDQEALVMYLAKTLNMAPDQAAKFAIKMMAAHPTDISHGASGAAFNAALPAQRMPAPTYAEAQNKNDAHILGYAGPQAMRAIQALHRSEAAAGEAGKPGRSLDVGDVAVKTLPHKPGLDVDKVEVKTRKPELDIGDVSVKSLPPPPGVSAYSHFAIPGDWRRGGGIF